MPTLILSSRRALVGKTAVAVGLARSLADAGLRPSLARVAASDADAAAESDARCFASLDLSPKGKKRPLSVNEAVKTAKASRSRKDVLILEMPAGLSPGQSARALDGVVVLVERFGTVGVREAASIRREVGEALGGMVVTAVPTARMAATADRMAADGMPCLALLPEDKPLASPSLAEMSGALEADLLFGDGHTEDTIEDLSIASIAADPGQEYFARFDHPAAVVRSDKPDLQIAALNAGAECLILTGGQGVAPHGMPLPYVAQRAEGDGIPLLVTRKTTVAAVQALEDLYLSSRFKGPRKAERIGQLVAAHLDGDALLRTLGVKQAESKAN
jgi:BioD-like phosphotransacetylase family protein